MGREGGGLANSAPCHDPSRPVRRGDIKPIMEKALAAPPAIALRGVSISFRLAEGGAYDAVARSDLAVAPGPQRLARLQQMLALAVARGLQVIVLTCDPQAYAGLAGTTLTLAPP